MAAPPTTPRLAPVGAPLGDPYPTTFAFSLDDDISFWEKAVTPPGFDGGDPIDITTMFNQKVRTRRSRSLLDLTEFTLTAAYDPQVYDQILAIANDDTGGCTVHFPNGGMLDFWGYLRIFAPNENAENGEQPTSVITVTPTNWDVVNATEEFPVYTPPAGT